MKFLGFSPLWWLALSAALSSVVGQNETETEAPTMILFDGCDMDTYYEELLQLSVNATGWTKEQLNVLVTDTHRNFLPTFEKDADKDDIYKAIIDLDPGSEPGTVRLVYRDIDAGDYPNGNPLYWDVERLYHEDRGYNALSPAYTDVHHVKPAWSTVISLKGNLSFGLCDTVEFEDACITPANEETAPDTAHDSKVFTPPVRFRGEIARALLYMDLRYDQLTVRDCGPFDEAMGYLSQLLEWHMMYPADESEILRNNLACQRWQGNRNPFIDYPELAEALHGQPEQIVEGTRTYPTCIESFPTASPTASRNSCGDIRRGDVPVFLVNTEDPDEVVFLPLFDIPGSTELYITDQAWNGSALVQGMEDEGTLVMMTPEDGIPQGTLFGYGPGVEYGGVWENDVEGFSLSTEEGDNIFLYCIDADEKIRFLAGFTNFGNWSLPGMSNQEYGEAMSALPDELEDVANIALPHLANQFFNGSRDQTIGLLRADMLNPASWVGDDEGRFGVEGFEPPPGNSAWTTMAITTALSLMCSLLFLLV